MFEDLPVDPLHPLFLFFEVESMFCFVVVLFLQFYIFPESAVKDHSNVLRKVVAQWYSAAVNTLQELQCTETADQIVAHFMF